MNQLIKLAHTLNYSYEKLLQDIEGTIKERDKAESLSNVNNCNYKLSIFNSIKNYLESVYALADQAPPLVDRGESGYSPHSQMYSGFLKCNIEILHIGNKSLFVRCVDGPQEGFETAIPKFVIEDENE